MNNEIRKVFEIEGGVDIMETPSVLTAICEYIIINGVKSDWETVYDAMRCLRIGDKKVEKDMRHRADGPSLEEYVGRMYKHILNLYHIWGKDSWVADGHKYVESKEDIIYLSKVCHLTRDYLYEYVYVYDEDE
mgnify:CR=1 FL=1